MQVYGLAANLKGVRVPPHTFRHTMAKFYILNGGDPFTLRRIFGHATLDMLDYYVELFSSDIKQQHKKFSPVENMKRIFSDCRSGSQHTPLLIRECSSARHGSRLDGTYRGGHQVLFDICARNPILDERPGFVFRFDLNLGKTALCKHGLQFADGRSS